MCVCVCVCVCVFDNISENTFSLTKVYTTSIVPFFITSLLKIFINFTKNIHDKIFFFE